MGFGEAVTDVPFLMFESLTHFPPSNHQPISTCYRKLENSKKRAYEQCVCEIEHSSFTPRMINPIAAPCMSWLRFTLSFAILRPSIQFVRGSCSAAGHAVKQQLPHIDLVRSEARLET